MTTAIALEIVFRSFWTWSGTLLLVVCGLGALSNGLVALACAIAKRKAPPLARDTLLEFMRDSRMRTEAERRDLGGV